MTLKSLTNFMRMLKFLLMTTLVIVAVSSASIVKAQLCGQSFARFVVSDSASGSVSNATIELLTVLPSNEYEELWDHYGNKKPGFQPNPFKIPSSVAADIIKQNPALSRTEDFCGNPLKQTANKTEVKTWDEARNKREGNNKNFGFCIVEGSSPNFLLKISAPGYVTDYYIGHYLSGCEKGWYFILTKRGISKKKLQSTAMPNKPMHPTADTIGFYLPSESHRGGSLEALDARLTWTR